MRIFYDENGNFKGSIETAIPGVEEKVTMAGAVISVPVPQELVERINSTTDTLQPQDLVLENDEVIVPTPNTTDAPAS